MRNFKNFPDEDSDDDEAVEGVIFDGYASEDSSNEDSTSLDGEPVAGPSRILTFPTYEPDTEDEENAANSPQCIVRHSDSEEESEEDAVVLAIKNAKARPKQHPPDIWFADHITDLSFHPGSDKIAIGSVTGDVYLYNYSLESCSLIETFESHSKACRAVEFSEDGNLILSCGKEKTIMITDVSNGKLLQFYDNPDDEPPYSLYIINHNIFCSGDEGGVLKVWDIRQKPPVCRFKVGDEQISAMITDEDEKYLVCASGETITAYDVNTRKFFVQSEPYETEMTSMKLMKQGKKLVVGTVKGTLYLFNWGQFGYHSDIYPGPKHNINSTIAVTENILVSGCGDGMLRAANLFPHKQLGVVGQHKLSIESTDISHDGDYIASCGFDETVKFWDVRYFEDIHVKAEKSKKTDQQNNLPSSKVRNPGDFFAGLS